MSAVLEQNSYPADAPATPPIVVIGTGPVGIRFVEELLQRNPDVPIVIYGNEPWEPYNRVRLAGLLTGELDFGDIQTPLRLQERHRVIQHHNREIIAIDRANRMVRDRLGNWQPYSKLVLATGSRPHIPDVDGIDKAGIFTFRNLNDAQQLIARRTRSRRAVVLGGGLLGLEAARGLRKYSTEVIIVEHARHLMSHQLDDEAGALLREFVMLQDIRVLLGDSIKRVLGDDRITGIELRSNRTIDCDTMVIAAGIRPNLELARDGGIFVGRGIRVNDRMQTNDPDVFAVGECVEHRDKVYGLVAPGLEQAGVAAHTITGGKSDYTGSQAATRLKVVGVSVFSTGCVHECDTASQVQTLSWRQADSGAYRRVLLQRGRIVGAISYGEWDESNRVQEAVQRARYLWPWQQRRFARTGKLWPAQEAVDVNDWPASAIVCQCTSISRGTLGKAQAAGHCSVVALSAHTGAGTVCGSCKPLLADLAGASVLEPEPGNRALVWTGIMSLLAVLAMLFAPAIPFADSVQVSIPWDQLWRNGLLKQISGFTLLGLGMVASLVSLRKRIGRIRFGDFAYWRVIHVVLGVLAVATLLAHTGLRLGNNLNLYLMLSFVGLLLVGAIAGGVIGLQHALPRTTAKRVREWSLWAHILLLWPLPALLGFHVFKSYWF